MIATRNFLIPALVTAVLAMAACEEIVTGQAVQSLAVSENGGGGYGPVRVALTPEMSPVAINFHARHGDDPSELNTWNSYRATLSRDGQEVASGQFNVNHTGTTETPEGARHLIRNLMTVTPSEAGDYELVITPTKPIAMKLYDTRIEVRRNVQKTEAIDTSQPVTERTLAR